jgi:ATP-binding cassette subfamily B (MDR/TAP) protein 1
MGGSNSKELIESEHSTGSVASDAKGKKKKETKPMASVSETMQFVFGCGPKVKWLFTLGFIGAILNGLVYPILAYLFSSSFADISGASSNGLSQVRDLAYTFMVVGTYALFVATIQGWCFEMVAYHATQRFRLEWFSALLRQDPAFFDVYGVGGLSNQVGPSSNKYRRGLGRKFGEGIQFLTTGIGGIAYAFYASWRVALVVLAVLPFAALAAMGTMTLNQTKGARASAAYKQAGGVAYSAVASIKTVLSLSAVPAMIKRYAEATQEAYVQGTKILLKIGFVNGSMLGSFLLLYAILTLYGSSLLYKDVEETGCDPSDGVEGNETCESSGPAVFGAMLGVAFAGQGISQFGNFSEAFTQARIAAYEALHAINRKPGAPEEIIYRTAEDDDLNTTTHSKKSKDDVEVAEGEKQIKAILPKYEIDASSDAGQRPQHIQGAISFKNVRFAYPARPNETVLNDLSVDIKRGQTVAFVGPRYVRAVEELPHFHQTILIAKTSCLFVLQWKRQEHDSELIGTFL